MNDWGLSVLNRYPLTIRGTRKVRGALLCDAAEGCFLLQEYRGSEKRLRREAEILSFIKEKGGYPADTIVADQEGKLLNRNDEGMGYILKNWYLLPECNVNSKSDLYQAVRLLAKLHLLLRQLPGETGKEPEKRQETGTVKAHEEEPGKMHEKNHESEPGLDEMYEKHTRELRRVRAYLLRKKKKSAIEECIVKSYSGMYRQAQAAAVHLEHSDYRRLAAEAVQKGWVYHGAYHQHNVLIGGGQIAAVNYERFGVGLQLQDLYQFMRKILEKHSWNQELGLSMLSEYQRILPLEPAEKPVLYAMFEYPEKYWKQINFYFNGNKAWIPPKSVEKLQNAAQQCRERERFLEYLTGKGLL